MLNFPSVPPWWSTGSKFMKLQKGFIPPDYIVGFDTETFNGQILTEQFYHSEYKKKQRKDTIKWVNKRNVLQKFLEFMERLDGNIICFCFNATFDLAILLREYIDLFLQDDFTIRHEADSGKVWEINVFCSKNWYASFKNGNRFVSFLDIHNYFSGTLDSVANTFNLENKKLTKPKNLGSIKYSNKDKKFVEYALMDALLCLEIGEVIVDMHEEFDIPMSTSSANFSEKVFRRRFIPENRKIHFPPYEAMRLSELTYHGGKNGYYISNPSLIHNCYEYDFNSAYPSAMYSLPSFMAGVYEKVFTFKDDLPGVYEVHGTIKPCRYGILHDTKFNYFRFSSSQKIIAFVTSFELQEALRSKEFKMDSCKGWVWKTDTDESPLREYAKYFWEKKNSTPKNDIRYIFYKLLMNSLYGKWIQRNPLSKPKYIYDKGNFELVGKQDVSGGLYNPFIATLITGHTRANLHKAEHYYSAIESSTDSVKSRRFDTNAKKIKTLGAMQLESKFCKDCKKDYHKFTGLFVRNRLNLLLCPKNHIVKCALHGFWGKPKDLYNLYLRKENWYTVERMPLIREGIQQQAKELFTMQVEERTLNISWDNLEVIR